MWLDTLLAYSLQIAVLITAGMLLPTVFRVRQPSARLAWLQGVFAACLLVPLWQPWATATVQPLVEFQINASSIATDQAVGPWRWLEIVAVMLGAGVAVRCLWLALGMLRLRRYRTNAERLSPVPGVIAQLQSRLDVHPECYLSNELARPLTFGIRPAVVLLPARFPEMPVETQEAIVCHELCHVRRCDWLVTFAEETVRGLFWFHPFVAWLIREMQLAREQVVDRRVVEITGSRQAYVAALIEIAGARVHPAIAMAPLFLGKRQITKRVEVLMKEVSMSKVRLVFSVVAMLLILAATGQFSAWSFPPQGAGQVSREEVYRVGGDVMEPKVIYKVGPEYTREAQDGNIEGTVVLSVNIRPNGRAHNIQVTKALGMGLDQKAIEAVEKWIFEPALKEGVPVTVLATIEIPFGEGWLRRPKEGVYRVGGDVLPPKPLYKPEPEYTEEARAAKLEGTVVFYVEIWPDGRAHNVRVVRSLDAGLDQKAIEAVEKWTFEPAQKDSRLVTVGATIEVNFRLRDDPKSK